VDHTSADAVPLLEQRELPSRFGLDVELFGGDIIKVHSIPAMLAHVIWERPVRDLAAHPSAEP
jgi:hypothetical protein